MVEIESFKAEISRLESYLNEHYFEDSEYHMGYSQALLEIKNLINNYEIE